MGCACEGEMQRELRKPSGETSFLIVYLDARFTLSKITGKSFSTRVVGVFNEIIWRMRR